MTQSSLTKIISGGQTGADQAGLFAARDLGLNTGGWVPHGWRTESGPRPNLGELFGLQEHRSTGYAPRTQANVIDSCATLVFGNQYSPGSKLTLDLCKRFGKYTIVVPWSSNQGFFFPHNYTLLGARELHIKRIRGIVRSIQPRVLNVAGNQESRQPGIFLACREFLVEALSE